MFTENLKAVRKMRGLTQEELAVRLHVVRQTVSKWEKGLSVPDADMLIKIAELFEISVSELLGATIEHDTNKNDIAEQLSRINEQLAIKNRRAKMVWKIVLGIILAIVVFNILLVLFSLMSFVSFHDSKHVEVTTQSEVFIPNE